jgi:hypothetical protein
MARKFKLLRKDGAGPLYPFTQPLFNRGDMKVVMMTKEEIDTFVNREVSAEDAGSEEEVVDDEQPVNDDEDKKKKADAVLSAKSKTKGKEEF